MSYLDTEFNIFENFAQSDPDTNIYTGGSKTYTVNYLYLLFVGSQDDATIAVPQSVATTGLTWVPVTSKTGTNEGLALYYATGATTTSTTVVTYDSTQTECSWHIVEIQKPSEILQSASNDGIGSDITVTLPLEIDAASLILSSFWSESLRTWTAGTGQTGLTTGVVNGFSQYNLGGTGVLPASIDSSNLKLGIGVEITETGSPATSVDTLFTLQLTDTDDDPLGTAVIHETTLGFDVGMTFELWPADVEANKEVASQIISLSSVATSTPQYTVTFTVAPSLAAGDTIHAIYVAGAGGGDIKSVTGGLSLASKTYHADPTMTC